MQQESKFPFNWEDWNELDLLTLQFYNVTFTDDFGSIKKGYYFPVISVSYDEGWIEAYIEDEEGSTNQVAHKVNFNYVPCI